MNFRLLRACFVTVGVLAVAGCATSYDKYLAQIDKANAAVTQEVQVRDAARQMDSQKIADISASGSDAAKVAGTLAIAMQNIVADMAKGGSAGGGSKVIVPQAPPDYFQSFIGLLGVALPTAVQAFGIAKNAQVATTQSNNAAAVAVSTNSTFATIATAGINGVASVNVPSNVTITAGGDAVNGNNNSTSRRTCSGGTSTSTGNGGNAAAGGAGGTGTTAGGAGAASGAAGQGNPSAVAGNGTC
jgi:hypothetical protein